MHRRLEVGEYRGLTLVPRKLAPAMVRRTVCAHVGRAIEGELFTFSQAASRRVQKNKNVMGVKPTHIRI